MKLNVGDKWKDKYGKNYIIINKIDDNIIYYTSLINNSQLACRTKQFYDWFLPVPIDKIEIEILIKVLEI